MVFKVINHFFIQKEGNSLDEYEDAFYYDDKGCCIAISDGATESSFSKEWANYIVKRLFPIPADTSIFLDSLDNCCLSFSDAINVSSLPWYAEEKFKNEGSYATIASMSIIKNQLRCLAVGDSCIFIVSDSTGEMISFPYVTSEQFNNNPNLLSSICLFNSEIKMNIDKYIANYDVNEDGTTTCYLATDALSYWIMKKNEEGNNPFSIIRGISSMDDFSTFIYTLRNNKEIRNDDVTLIVARIE